MFVPVRLLTLLNWLSPPQGIRVGGFPAVWKQHANYAVNQLSTKQVFVFQRHQVVQD